MSMWWAWRCVAAQGCERRQGHDRTIHTPSTTFSCSHNHRLGHVLAHALPVLAPHTRPPLSPPPPHTPVTGCQLAPGGAGALARAAAEVGGLQGLRMGCLADNRLGAEGMAAVCAAVLGAPPPPGEREGCWEGGKMVAEDWGIGGTAGGRRWGPHNLSGHGSCLLHGIYCSGWLKHSILGLGLVSILG